MDYFTGGRRMGGRSEGVRSTAASGAPDWLVASVERAVWCLLAGVAVLMAYLCVT